MWLQKVGNHLTSHITSHPRRRHYYYSQSREICIIIAYRNVCQLVVLSLFLSFSPVVLLSLCFFFIYFASFSQSHSVLFFNTFIHLYLFLTSFVVNYDSLHSGSMINGVGCDKNTCKALAVVRKCPSILLQKVRIILVSVN